MLRGKGRERGKKEPKLCWFGEIKSRGCLRQRRELRPILVRLCNISETKKNEKKKPKRKTIPTTNKK